MKKRLSLSCSLFGSVLGIAILSLSAAGQSSAPYEWAWMGGSSMIPDSGGESGVYGTLYIPAAGNVPGARMGPASWTDGSGNFWLFGGIGFDAEGNEGHLNDLWEFNPSTAEWAWMGGSSKLSLMPDSHYGQPGVYGTLGTPSPANIPGGRWGATRWTDSNGHFLLFGGYGFDASGTEGYLNDLWEFNPATNEWTWVSGSSTVGANGGHSGVYGKLGTPAAGNIPGGRFTAVSWTDGGGNLWLFGGYGYDAKGKEGLLNDVWEFNPSTNKWAWMGGSSALDFSKCNLTINSDICGQPGVYGTLRTPAAGNVPGGREDAATWIDGNGHFWLFGSLGFGASQI